MILEEIKEIMQANKEKLFYNNITYGMLYEYILRLSNYLKSMEKRSKRILIYGHKDINIIISMLSCAYAGITYIPVDVSFSKERVQDIVDISNPDAIINTTNELLDMEIDENTKLIDSNTINNIIKESKCDNKELISKLKPEDIYYTIFTSGSTGAPKGVKITYKNLDTFCNNILKKINIKNNSVVLNQALFSFDLSIADIYITLLSASRYVMLSSDEIKDYPRLFKKIKDENIEVIVATPSFIDYLLIDKSFNSKNIKRLNTIITCGEILSRKTVENIESRYENIIFINSYGPTECTVAVTSIRVDSTMDVIPIGNCEDNTFCIVDDNLEKTEKIGNILIYGNLVTDGYINYSNEPFVSYEGKKAYLTGDIGYVEDNKLYYLNRKDRQVKLNGYRVELGEIENKILCVDSVDKCVVVDKKNIDGRIIKIVAYVITSDTKEELKEKLKGKISSYMFPEIRIVEELPLNGNYKIDIKKIRNEENERKDN